MGKQPKIKHEPLSPQLVAVQRKLDWNDFVDEVDKIAGEQKKAGIIVLPRKKLRI